MTTAPPSRENYSILLLTLICPQPSPIYASLPTLLLRYVRIRQKKISSPRSKSILNPRIFPLPRCDPKRGVFARPRQCSILISDKSTNPYQLYFSNPTPLYRNATAPSRSDPIAVSKSHLAQKRLPRLLFYFWLSLFPEKEAEAMRARGSVRATGVEFRNASYSIFPSLSLFLYACPLIIAFYCIYPGILIFIWRTFRTREKVIWYETKGFEDIFPIEKTRFFSRFHEDGIERSEKQRKRI